MLARRGEPSRRRSWPAAKGGLHFWRTWWECEDCRTDSTPPAVSISSPHDGDVLSGSVLVTADATDNVRLGTVSIRVDGIELAALAAPPYSVAWDTRRVPNGIHELSALATDAVGNAQLSGAIVEGWWAL